MVLTALKQWQKNLDWHGLEDQQVVKKCHYSHRGKPRLQEQPTRPSYSVFHLTSCIINFSWFKNGKSKD